MQRRQDEAIKLMYEVWQAGASGGGANRDRTDDLLRARQALSQLSYGPSFDTWWVWEELHPRPHPYQGCALTN